MSLLRKGLLSIVLFVIVNSQQVKADVLVQLNVNRPLNDLDERFLSFAVNPEELYKSLDGPHRRTATRLASILGDSYLKFTSDYDFANNSSTKLRNPTRIIWKGFNRWARAINWTMVIPVPYEPGNWDPMQTLKILNTSYMSGITSCVWQLGTDFGSAYAKDYVSELSTLNLMVDSFRQYTENWRIMGADISAGSSAEETRRYVEISKDLNTAFGWVQPEESDGTTSISTAQSLSNDAALRALLREKVNVWLTMAKKTYKSNNNNKELSKLFEDQYPDETEAALDWAQTLGEAATGGFNVIFKRIHPSELERPNFPYYVSAIFKKVMGSRVFPAKPLNAFTRSNKLYTHCANSVSGGIAFMIVNPNDRKLSLTVRASTKLTESEVWQYTLTSQDGDVYLNDEKLTVNSTVEPFISSKNAIKSLQLSTPARSVSFWILPDVNLEHCQYTEVEEEPVKPQSYDSSETSGEGQNKKYKRYTSSSDKLLRKLIQESSMANNPLARAINRRRRFAETSGREKRFILEDNNGRPLGLGKILRRLVGITSAEEVKEVEEKRVKKSEKSEDSISPRAPLKWIKQIVDHTLDTVDLPILSRRARSIDDDYFGPLFATRDGKTTKAFTKKITEIRQPEEQVKPIFDLDDFDEEEFFKKLGSYHREPEPPRLPEGDIHLKHITNIDGEEIDEDREEYEKHKVMKKNTKLSKNRSKEIVSEMKPLRLLPTEFYEALPLKTLNPFNKENINLASPINALVFPEPFSKKQSKHESPSKKSRKTNERTSSREIKETDFLRAQRELSKTILDNRNAKAASDSSVQSFEENFRGVTTEKAPIILEAQEKKPVVDENNRNKFFNYLSDTSDNYFGEKDSDDAANGKDSDGIDYTNKEFDALPWWDFSSALSKNRMRRALHFDMPDDLLRSNIISRDTFEIDDNLLPYESPKVIPEKLTVYEYKIDGLIKAQNNNKPNTDSKDHHSNDNKIDLSSGTDKAQKNETLVTTVKEKVTSFIDFVARRITDLYHTLTKPISEDVISVATVEISVPPKGNAVN